MAKYMLRRYHERRAEAFQILGGVCKKCGAVENLQIDHINAEEKELSGDSMIGVSRPRFLAEIAKCQLLCGPCHVEKTVVVDRGRRMARGTHGTLSSYRYCHCELCKEAKRRYGADRRARKQGHA